MRYIFTMLFFFAMCEYQTVNICIKNKKKQKARNIFYDIFFVMDYNLTSENIEVLVVVVVFCHWRRN